MPDLCRRELRSTWNFLAAPGRTFHGEHNLVPSSHESDLPTLIDAGLRELGLTQTPQVQDRLHALALLLARWAPQINLTGHRGPEAITRRLIFDALSLAPHLPRFETFADIGSGAGFPGLPLAIVYPLARLSSVEPREKRAFFQRSVVRELSLTNTTIHMGRSEDLSPTPHDLVIAQALAKPARALDWMIPWVKSGGWLAIPTGLDVAVQPLIDHPAITDVTSIRYRVALGGGEHQLLLGRLVA